MTFICDCEGNRLDLDDPRPESFRAFDIAWSLSQQNRFLGRCLRPYSIAEHSLLVCEIAEREFGLDVSGQLVALMHDAHEAFVGDQPTPHKAQIGAAWTTWETRWQRDTLAAFALRTASCLYYPQVKKADLIALATEKRDLLAASPWPWTVLDGIEPCGWVDLRERGRASLTWEDWRDAWLDKYHELDFARNEQLGMNVPRGA